MAMKKYYLFSVLAIAAMAAFSCTKEIELSPVDNEATPVVNEPLVINAYSDDDIATDTKTTLDGVNVRWASTDAIAGYKSDDVNPHTSTLTSVAEGGKKATFTFSELTIGDNVTYLIYPFSAAGTEGTGSNVGKYNITLPSVQTATPDGFADGANLALADGDVDADAVQFKNIGALIGFSIANDNVASVEFSANEAMTGHALVTPGNPVAPSVTKDGLTYVEMTGGITNGSQYYAVVYPGTYTGLTIKVTDTDGKLATYTNPNALTLNRNDNKQIADLTVADGKWKTLTRTNWSHTISTKVWTENGAQTISGQSWTLAGDGGFWGDVSAKGQQLGSSGSPYKSLTLTSNFGVDKGINEVLVNAATASSSDAKISVLIGGHQLECNGNTSVSLAESSADYDFKTVGDKLLTGDVVILITQSTSKALYLKSIEVNPLEAVKTPQITITSNTATITCETEGATIYYTTNGSTPTASSTEYSAPFDVALDVTVKAIAVKDGMRNSAVASKTNERIASLNFSFSASGITNNTAITNVSLPDGMKYDTSIAAAQYKCYANYLGMRSNNCAYIVHFDVAAASIDFTGKGQSASGNKITVSGSSDGSDYVDIEEFSVNDSNDTKKTVSKSINSSYRYIKFTFSKSSGNYALKEINIKK